MRPPIWRMAFPGAGAALNFAANAKCAHSTKARVACKIAGLSLVQPIVGRSMMDQQTISLPRAGGAAILLFPCAASSIGRAMDS
jgi:hypothetical protein